MKTTKHSKAAIYLLLPGGKGGEIRALLELPEPSSETDPAKAAPLSRREFSEVVRSRTDVQVNVYTTHLLFFV